MPSINGIDVLESTVAADYVDSGLDHTYNSGGPTVDIGSGVVVLEGTGSEDYKLDVQSVSSLSLTDNDQNTVWLSFDPSTGASSADYVIEPNESAPSEPAVKVLEIDTSADSVAQLNQNPLFPMGRPRSAVPVTKYGAVGDGSTDDTLAIQKAIDNERAVYFPKHAEPASRVNGGDGDDFYKITGQITISSTTHLSGELRTSIIGITSDPNNGEGIFEVTANWVSFENLWIDADSGGATNGAWDSIIRYNSADHGNIQHLRLSGKDRGPRAAIEYDGVNGADVSYVDIQTVNNGIRFENNTRALHMDQVWTFNTSNGWKVGSGEPNQVIVESAYSSSDDTVNVEDADRWSFNFASDGATNTGLTFDGRRSNVEARVHNAGGHGVVVPGIGNFFDVQASGVSTDSLRLTGDDNAAILADRFPGGNSVEVTGARNSILAVKSVSAGSDGVDISGDENMIGVADVRRSDGNSLLISSDDVSVGFLYSKHPNRAGGTAGHIDADGLRDYVGTVHGFGDGSASYGVRADSNSARVEFADLYLEGSGLSEANWVTDNGRENGFGGTVQETGGGTPDDDYSIGNLIDTSDGSGNAIYFVDQDGNDIQLV